MSAPFEYSAQTVTVDGDHTAVLTRTPEILVVRHARPHPQNQSTPASQAESRETNSLNLNTQFVGDHDKTNGRPWAFEAMKVTIQTLGATNMLWPPIWPYHGRAWARISPKPGHISSEVVRSSVNHPRPSPPSPYVD
jgi:hypothetical protein